MKKDLKDNGSHHEIQRDVVKSCKEMESKHRWSNCRYESITKGWNCSHEAILKKSISEGSSIFTLNLFLGNDGVLRDGGRINKSSLEYRLKHPALFSKEGRITHDSSETIMKRLHILAGECNKWNSQPLVLVYHLQKCCQVSHIQMCRVQEAPWKNMSTEDGEPPSW